MDILSTGEQQSRLPDDVGQVRDQEHAQPPVADVPEGFSLTPPAETEHTQPDLLRSAEQTLAGGGFLPLGEVARRAR